MRWRCVCAVFVGVGVGCECVGGDGWGGVERRSGCGGGVWCVGGSLPSVVSEWRESECVSHEMYGGMRV